MLLAAGQPPAVCCWSESNADDYNMQMRLAFSGPEPVQCSLLSDRPPRTEEVRSGSFMITQYREGIGEQGIA